MSAHSIAGEGPAHDSTPPPGSSKMKFVNVDSSGFSMSWKSGVSIIISVITVMLVLTAFAASIAKKSDVAAHDVSSQAHPIVMEKGAESEPTPTVVKAIAKEHHGLRVTIGTLNKSVQENKTESGELKDTINVRHAEQLADRAADKLKTNNPTHYNRRWRRVKDKALSNVKADPPKPMRDGLEELL